MPIFVKLNQQSLSSSSFLPLLPFLLLCLRSMLMSPLCVCVLMFCSFVADDKADDVLLNRSFLRILELLSPDSSERVVLDACERLNELGKQNPEQVRALMTTHGVIPIMEMLEVTNPHILVAILRVVNQIVGRNLKFAQNMSLVGLIPAIIRFGGANYPREIRMEAASFVRQFCYASDWTRKMFIACDGLEVLVSFLLEEYENSKTLVWNAVDVSDTHTHTRALENSISLLDPTHPPTLQHFYAHDCSLFCVVFSCCFLFPSLLFLFSLLLLPPSLFLFSSVSVTCSISPLTQKTISVVFFVNSICWNP